MCDVCMPSLAHILNIYAGWVAVVHEASEYTRDNFSGHVVNVAHEYKEVLVLQKINLLVIRTIYDSP